MLLLPGFQDFFQKLMQKPSRMIATSPRLSANMLALASNIGCLNITLNTVTITKFSHVAETAA